jgi:hypothetical protein
MISVKTQVIGPVGATGELCMLWLQLELRLELGLEMGLELWLGGVKSGIGVISSDVRGTEGISPVAMGTNEELQANSTEEDIYYGTTQ